MLYAIVKKTYNVPEPEVGAVKPAVNKTRIVKFVKLSPSQSPQPIQPWMTETAIYKAAVEEGSIVEVVMKSRPKKDAPAPNSGADGLGLTTAPVPGADAAKDAEDAGSEGDASEGDADESGNDNGSDDAAPNGKGSKKKKAPNKAKE